MVSGIVCECECAARARETRRVCDAHTPRRSSWPHPSSSTPPTHRHQPPIPPPPPPRYYSPPPPRQTHTHTHRSSVYWTTLVTYVFSYCFRKIKEKEVHMAGIFPSLCHVSSTIDAINHHVSLNKCLHHTFSWFGKPYAEVKLHKKVFVPLYL